MNATVLPTVRVHLTVSLTGPGRPQGLVGESFTLVDQPLRKGQNQVEPPLPGITFVKSMSQMILALLAVLRQFYLARLTEDEVRVELLSVADTLRERCEEGATECHG